MPKIITPPFRTRPVAPPHFLHDSARGGVFRDYLITEKEMNRNRLDTCIDWLIRLVAVMSLLMTGFSAGHGDYLVAFCFATGLVNAVLLMTIRKEMKNGK